ncbi:hypothetical protein ACLKA7_017216 [Drosophila subpalustris]
MLHLQPLAFCNLPHLNAHELRIHQMSIVCLGAPPSWRQSPVAQSSSLLSRSQKQHPQCLQCALPFLINHSRALDVDDDDVSCGCQLKRETEEEGAKRRVPELQSLL